MSRIPEYRVAALNKQTDAKGAVGAAWINEDKSISIILDPFVVLHGGKELLITLFPNKSSKSSRKREGEEISF